MTFTDPDTSRVEFSIADAISQTGEIMGRNFFPYSFLYMVLSIPSFLIFNLLDDPGLGVIIVGILVAAVTLAFPEVFITRMAYGDLYGKSRDEVKDMLPERSVFERVIGVLILFTFAFFVGLILLILPGVALWLMLFFVVPAIVVDNKSVWGSVQQSVAVAEGYRGAVYIAVFVYVAIFMTVDLLLEGPAASSEIMLAFQFVWEGVGSAYGIVLSLVIYEKLKAAKAAKAGAG